MYSDPLSVQLIQRPQAPIQTSYWSQDDIQVNSSIADLSPIVPHPSEEVILSFRIADILEHSCKINDPIIQGRPQSGKEACFFAASRHSFSFRQYVDYVMHKTNYSISVYVVALAYMFRTQKANPNFRICSLNVHRMFVSCVLLAAKYLEHAVMLNSEFGKICGIDDVSKINQLELIMLQALCYDLRVTEMGFKFVFYSLMV